MNEIQFSKLLGLTSLVIGGVEVFAARRLTRALGLPVPEGFVRFFLGPREIVNGFVALAHPDDTGPIATRVAGDALDLALLANALIRRNGNRQWAVLATAAVIGVTALDVAASAALARRNTKALATARRTRVKQILPA